MSTTDKPPPLTAINRAHALAKGMLAYWSFHDTFTDLMNGLTLARSSTASFDRRGLLCDAASEGAQVNTPPYLQLQYPFTIACQLVILASGSQFCQYFGAYPNNADATPYFSYGLASDDAGHYRFAISDGGSMYRIDAGVIAVGRHILVGAAISGDQQLYLDNVSVAAAMTHTGALSYTGTALVAAGSHTGVTFTPNAVIEWGAIWNRRLSVSEIAYLNKNPYAFLQSPRTSMYIVGAGPTPITVDTLTIDSLAGGEIV